MDQIRAFASFNVGNLYDGSPKPSNGLSPFSTGSEAPSYNFPIFKEAKALWTKSIVLTRLRPGDQDRLQLAKMLSQFNSPPEITETTKAG